MAADGSTREADLKTITRFVVSGACLLGVAGHAGAQSASEFWQSEWQRQQPRVSSLDPSGRGRGAFQQQGERFGRQNPIGYPRAPEGQSPLYGNARRDRGKMPTVRVSNPDFFTYVPDKLTNVSLGSVCEVQNG